MKNAKKVAPACVSNVSSVSIDKSKIDNKARELKFKKFFLLYKPIIKHMVINKKPIKPNVAKKVMN